MNDTPKKGNDTRDASSSSSDEIFWVEKILKKRYTRKKGVEYFIKWKKFDDEDNSWVSEKNCEGCKEAIKEFEKEIQNNKNEAMKKKRSKKSK